MVSPCNMRPEEFEELSNDNERKFNNLRRKIVQIVEK